MNFNIETDFHIFDEIIQNRPEINLEDFKKTLDSYYLPFVEKIITLKDQKNTLDGLIVGVSAIQGAGKTTQGEIMEILLRHLGHTSISLSIDDHYITHKELCTLRNTDPRYIRRGVTHDLPLAILNLRDLRQMRDGEAIIISGYDKSANQGDGERYRWVEVIEGTEMKLTVIQEQLVINKMLQDVWAMKLVSLKVKNQEIPLAERMGSSVPIIENILPTALIKFLENHKNQEITVTKNGESIMFVGESNIEVDPKDLPIGWRIVDKKPSFIFYDGWMLGARMVSDDTIFESGLPGIETADDIDFAKMINKKLENYEPLWEMLEFVNMLYVPDYKISITWREQAEKKLREKGSGMSERGIIDFVHYFWRSVHPAVQIQNLAEDTRHTNQVVVINDDHSIKEIISPEEVLSQYSRKS